jgi:hypothetical protein
MLDCPVDGEILVDDIIQEINSKEVSLGNPGTDGMILSSLVDGTRSWVDLPNSAVWGSITGTLSNQTDLQSALDLKVSSDVSSDTGSNAILNMVSLTQAEYDALTPVETTLYIIVDDLR